MSLQLPTILSPPTPCTPVPALTVSPQVRPRSCRCPFPGRLPSWASPFPPHARQCIWPYRVHHFLNYGLVVRFRLPSTPPSRRRSCLQLRTASALSDGDFRPAVGAHSQAHGGTASVPSHSSFLAPITRRKIGRHGGRPSLKSTNAPADEWPPYS